jgi:hypothetical protein
MNWDIKDAIVIRDFMNSSKVREHIIIDMVLI